MTTINHNYGNGTGNGNQSDSGENEEDRPERPGILYGRGLHTIRAVPVPGGLRVDTNPHGSSEGWSRVVYETVDDDGREDLR